MDDKTLKEIVEATKMIGSIDTVSDQLDEPRSSELELTITRDIARKLLNDLYKKQGSAYGWQKIQKHLRR